MATLHLHTDVSRFNSSSMDHQHQHQLQQQHDYAAVTPTAARPHPERSMEGGGYGSLFDAFIPPQYAYPSGDNGVLHRPAAVYPHQQQHIYMNPQQQDGVTYGGQEFNMNLNMHNINSSSTNTETDYGSLSSSSESVSSVASADGPGTPPPSSFMSNANVSPAPSFNSVPGNTIYNSQGYAGSGATLPSYGGYGHAQGSSIIDQQHLLQPHQPHYHHHQQQQACDMEYMNAYNNYNAAQLTSFPNQFYQDQYALYNAGVNNNNNASSMPVHVTHQQQYPTMLPDGGDMNIKQASNQIGPSMTYDTVSQHNAHAMTTPSVLAGMPISAPVAATIPGAFTLMQGSHGLSQRRASSGHASQGSISSIHSVSAHGSPAPSHSGSDDSGNTTKSAFSSHYSSAASLSRSSSNAGSAHSHSRRGSVSSAAGTPYGKITIRKDGIGAEDGSRKFTCSYPGCNRSFSRNFNLSTHYNTHLGVKPFPCSHCPKSFSRRHDCARHVAAVHSDKKSSSNTNVSAGAVTKQDGEISPNTCGCGHTCPSHVLAGNDTIVFAPSTAATPGATAGMKDSRHHNEGQVQSIQPRTSVFSFIKGSAEDDEHFSSSSGGYESAASSSVESYISGSNNEYIFGSSASSFEIRRSPSLALSLPASLDFNLVKLEEVGEGE